LSIRDIEFFANRLSIFQQFKLDCFFSINKNKGSQIFHFDINKIKILVDWN